MPSLETWAVYTLACVFLVLAPGPGNLLAVGRGLSQGWAGAAVSGASSGTGILFHVIAATLGLTLLIQASAVAFLVVKVIGACYLIALGIRVLLHRGLVDLEPARREPARKIFAVEFFTAALNPKPGLFVLAFIPQFIEPPAGPVWLQMAVLGGWFALLTAVGFALIGGFAGQIARWLRGRPRVVGGLNIGAGLVFIGTGLSVAAMSQR